MFPIAILTEGYNVKDQLLLQLMTDTFHIRHNVCREVCRSQYSCVLLSRWRYGELIICKRDKSKSEFTILNKIKHECDYLHLGKGYVH